MHLLPPHVYLQLLLGWGEHGLAGAVCATVALSHIAAAAAILSPSSVTILGVPAILNETLRSITSTSLDATHLSVATLRKSDRQDE